MKLSVTQENFAKALSNIGRVASGRVELPILNNILLRTDGGRLLIAATNLEIASTQYIGAKIQSPGSITIPARLISEFISTLPSGTIDLETKDDHLHITSGKFKSVINGVIADEFPELPTINEDTAVRYEIATDDLKKAVSQTILAASSDMARAVLTGVYWHTFEDELYLAATDGYRLAERKLMKADGEVSAIIPTSALQEVIRSLSDATETIVILFGDDQVCFQTPELEIISRLIDGKFPDYRQLIPQQSQTEIIVSRADLSRITKVASLFARDSGGGVTINASAENNIISIHSIASELGENTSEATAKISADGQITLNSRYLTEALNVTDGEEVSFAFSGKLSPCIIQSTAKKRDYIHIIMPLKS